LAKIDVANERKQGDKKRERGKKLKLKGGNPTQYPLAIIIRTKIVKGLTLRN